jgi:hypothetical protein
MAGIDPFMSWAQQSPLVKALILTGSRANPLDTIDELSDYDLVVVTTDTSFMDDEWLSHISPYWVCSASGTNTSWWSFLSLRDW